MNKVIIRTGLVLAMLTNSLFVAAADKTTNAPTPTAANQRTAAIFQFTSPSMPASPSLAAQACAAYRHDGDTSDSGLAVSAQTTDRQLAELIASELQANLAKKKFATIVDPYSDQIPTGAIVITGCILEADKGSTAGRMFGMGAGASKLAAHVVLSSKTETGFVTLDSFDLQIKGRSFSPPSPVTIAVHAATERSKTLSADARKLADRIAKRVANDAKAGSDR